MTADLRVALDTHRRLSALLTDPECVGHVLLVALALLARLDMNGVVPNSLSAMGELVQPTGVTHGGEWVKTVIRRDARGYEPPFLSYSAPCEAPMIRRDGYCGRTGGGLTIPLRDYETGELRPVKACSKHRVWVEELWRCNRAEAPDPDAPRGGAPLPTANHGGVLARHFPEIDWYAYWAKIDPHWVEHPEDGPRPDPKFTLVVGDGAGTDDADRPALSLVPAGRNAQSRVDS